jgi:hypothetical protein
MTNKNFVKLSSTGAYCAEYCSGPEKYIIVAYPNTMWFGTAARANTPKMAWKKAADILRKRMLERFES